MRRGHLLLLASLVALTLPGLAHAQGIPWRVRPTVVIDGPANDPRVPLVHAVVAHWNQILAGIGSGFRLGRVTVGGGAAVGKIQVFLSDGEFVSHVDRYAGGQGAVVMIRNTRGRPMSLPNVPRNVIAHELGHTLGLTHNGNTPTLMCGPCQHTVYRSNERRFFPLTPAERERLQTLYPAR